MGGRNAAFFIGGKSSVLKRRYSSFLFFVGTGKIVFIMMERFSWKETTSILPRNDKIH